MPPHETTRGTSSSRKAFPFMSHTRCPWKAPRAWAAHDDFDDVPMGFHYRVTHGVSHVGNLLQNPKIDEKFVPKLLFFLAIAKGVTPEMEAIHFQSQPLSVRSDWKKLDKLSRSRP